MNKDKNCYKFNQDLMPDDWKDGEPVNNPTKGVKALTADDLDEIDIDALYEPPKKGRLKSYIHLKKGGNK